MNKQLNKMNKAYFLLKSFSSLYSAINHKEKLQPINKAI